MAPATILSLARSPSVTRSKTPFFSMVRRRDAIAQRLGPGHHAGVGPLDFAGGADHAHAVGQVVEDGRGRSGERNAGGRKEFGGLTDDQIKGFAAKGLNGVVEGLDTFDPSLRVEPALEVGVALRASDDEHMRCSGRSRGGHGQHAHPKKGWNVLFFHSRRELDVFGMGINLLRPDTLENNRTA